MKVSKQARRDAKALFRSAVVDGVLDEDRVRQILRAVIDQKPRGYMGVLVHLERLVKLEVERRTARVHSAAVLDAAERKDVERSLTTTYGPGLRVEYAEDPQLVGGLRVQVGSDVYDGTIRSRLDRLEQKF